MKLIAWLLRLVIFLLLLLFALQNQHTVALHGLFGTQATWPLAWVLALTLCVGALLGVLAMLPRALGRKRQAPPPSPVAKDITTRDNADELGV